MNLFDLMNNVTSEVKQLEEDIPKYAKAYYEGKALISDLEFDKLVDRLRKLKPDSAILHTPRMGI